MKKRTYDDDDGRRIADMTGVDAPSSLFTFRRPPDRDPKKRERRDADAAQETSDGNAAPTMNRDERFAAVVGALAAALLIALAFIVGLGAMIWLLLFVWR